MTKNEELLAIIGTFNEITELKGVTFKRVFMPISYVHLYDQLQADSNNVLWATTIKTRLLEHISIPENKIDKLSQLIQIIFNDKSGNSRKLLPQKKYHDG